MKLEGVLDRVVELIVRACDPEMIMLFGSYAKGQGNSDSDLDLLVISNFQGSPYLRGQEVRELLRRFPISIDLHLVTREEVAGASGKPYGFLSSVLASGVTLYKKGIDKPSI
jgi:predicted nucleotidyltransferase